MTSLFLLPIVLSATLLQQPTDPAPSDVAGAAATKSALADACKALAEAKSYAFHLKTESTGGGFGGGRGGRADGGGGGGGPRPPVEMDGRYQEGQPMQLQQGELTAFLNGDILVFKNPEGVFEKFDRDAMRGRGGRGGGPLVEPEGKPAEGTPPAGQAGGTPPAAPPAAGSGEPSAEGGRPPRGGPGGGMMGLMNLTRALPPHRLVKDMDGKVKDVVKSERDGKVVYQGALTDEAARQLAGAGGRGGRGGDGPERTSSGTFEVVVGAGGAVESILLSTKTSMDFGDRVVEQERKSTYQVSDVGKTSVEVPADAAKLFEI